MPTEVLQNVAQIVARDSRYGDIAKRFSFIDANHGTANFLSLQPILSLVQPKVVCEVGSYMGCSARFFAGFPSVEEVVCVDHWDRNLVENYKPGVIPEDWLDFAYEHFMANCIHSKTDHKIYPVRHESIAGAKYLSDIGKKFDLIYIDGAHATDIVRQDLVNYFSLLKPGGFFCGDDWVFDKEPENVQGPVMDFARERALNLYAAGNFWWCKPLPVG